MLGNIVGNIGVLGVCSGLMWQSVAVGVLGCIGSGTVIMGLCYQVCNFGMCRHTGLGAAFSGKEKEKKRMVASGTWETGRSGGLFKDKLG